MINILALLISSALAAPLTFEIPTCASFTFANNVLTCVPATGPPPPIVVDTPPIITPPPTAGMELCKGLRVIGNQALPFAGSVGGMSSSSGAFGDDVVWLFSLTVPAGQAPTSTVGYFQAAEYQGQSTSRHLTLSRYACDFRPYDPYGNNGPVAQSRNGTTAAVQFTVGVDRTRPGVMLAGTTYFFSVRNWSDFPLPNGSGSCGITSCNATFNYQPTR